MRKHKVLFTNEDIKRENWILELEKLGVSSGPQGEDLRSLDYYTIRNLMVREEIRREE
ncbi:hypothetical protein B0H99_101296 [Planomicrobium soli]|uniref:Fur-regulated basic protein A n=1 Tax=Planomicrobium soli TaxID=1176648 RepID=A0A2P8H742_9BACL|nr:hypothetical protein [Planomicrobium soli]PSL42048.1 hypothetical protein B0H99_101296 [Planomicrobium soli]